MYVCMYIYILCVYIELYTYTYRSYRYHPTSMQVAEKTHRARIVTKAEVFKLLQNGRNVVGCEYRKAGKVVKAGGSAGGSGENLEAV